jgi:RNA polymerase sigma-70 factor (sigma-E family)
LPVEFVVLAPRLGGNPRLTSPEIVRPLCQQMLVPGVLTVWTPSRAVSAALSVRIGAVTQTADERWAADDPADIAEFVARLHRTHAITLIRAAKLLLRDQQSAEDVVQDAFLSLYRALPRLSDHEQILPYLRTAVINRARSVLRARSRAQRHPAQPDVPEWSAEAAAMVREDQRAVLRAVAGLPRRAREVLVLRYYLDLSDSEIAATLGVSRGTVSSAASRALAALGRDLKETL